jgi:hypothetical protein
MDTAPSLKSMLHILFTILDSNGWKLDNSGYLFTSSVAVMHWRRWLTWVWTQLLFLFFVACSSVVVICKCALHDLKFFFSCYTSANLTLSFAWSSAAALHTCTLGRAICSVAYRRNQSGQKHDYRGTGQPSGRDK